jgi:hypothetical protein
MEIIQSLKGNNKSRFGDFDLLQLHRDTDIHPRSWVCIKGDGIKEIVNKIESKVIKEKSLTREAISKILSKRLNCSFNSFKYLLRNKNEFYPIVFIKEIIKLCNDNSYLDMIRPKIKYLKINSASSKEVLAIKTLTPNLCKILGAFMADGSLIVTFQLASKNRSSLKHIKMFLKENNFCYNEWSSKSRNEHSISFTVNQNNCNKIGNIINLIRKKVNIQTNYKIEIADEHKSNLESFRQWFWETFKIPENSFRKKEGAWRLSYSNKIIARCLMVFFDVVPGPKSYTAFEPKIIRTSNIKLRKLFARGVAMFDGSFTSAGKLEFSSKSGILFESIKNILNNDKIKFGTSVNRGEFSIFTYESVEKEKILFYFEKGTNKWHRVRDSFIFKKQKIEELTKRYRVYSMNKVTLKTLYDVIKKSGSCDWNYLSNYFNCARSLLKPYLRILENSFLIKVSKHPKKISVSFIDDSLGVLLQKDTHDYVFNKIKECHGTYKRFGNYIKIEKGTISAWKLRKNRIPLKVLKDTCEVCNIDYSSILQNIEETDRRIIEII